MNSRQSEGLLTTKEAELPFLVCISGQVSHSEVEAGAQEGAVARRLELEEELARSAHDRARQLAHAAEGPDQRRKLVHAVVNLPGKSVVQQNPDRKFVTPMFPHFSTQLHMKEKVQKTLQNSNGGKFYNFAHQYVYS